MESVLPSPALGTVANNILQERVLLEGLEWGTSEAVDKLKKMLWGLEALRVFDDRLSASLAQIQKARESMERTIKQVYQRFASVFLAPNKIF